MSTTEHGAAAHMCGSALGEGFVTAWGRIHVDLCRLTGAICRG